MASTLLRVVLTVSALLATTVQVASSTPYCKNLNDGELIVGEARFTVSASGKSYYANAYHDGGNELNIAQGALAGYLSANQTFDILIGGYIIDSTTGNCADALIRLEVWEKHASSCASTGSSLGWYEYKINTCNVGGYVDNLWQYYGGDVLRVSGVPKKDAYYYIIDIKDSGSVVSSDSGCFSVGDSFAFCG